MIVKDKAAVICRCLDSVRPLIGYWIIVETGSTDGTKDIVRAHLKDLPGELHERPWRDFGHNRSEALALARRHGDYSLILDADDALDLDKGFQLPELRADSYTLDICDTAIRYQRIQLVRNALPWRYRGVLHEFLAFEGASASGHLPIAMRRNHDGARRRDPETYRKDATILAEALMTETDPFLIARYTFCLAQSYRDCGEKERAIAAYLRRAELGHWVEKVFCSLLTAARLKEELGHNRDDILTLYMRATGVVSGRAEALHDASRLCRYAGRYQEGYAFAKRGLALSAPRDGLFVEPWIYDYGLLDEFAVNAYWAGNYDESHQACRRLLGEGKLSPERASRIAANAHFAARKLPPYHAWHAAVSTDKS